jgi:predicted RNase H-like nuclease (RuvC/YqgF family)
MTTPVTLEFLAEELALVRTELRCIIETLCRLDETHAHLDQRLIAMRDEVQDAQSAMRSVRAELVAHHRLQDQIGQRLLRLEQMAALGTKGKTQ